MLNETTKSDSAAKSDSSAKSDAKSTSGSGDAAPANYSRGEGQKLVTRAYRENWLAIFGKPARTTASPKRAAKTKRKPAAKAKTKTRRKGRR